MTLIAHINIDGNVRDQRGTNHGTWTGIEAYGNQSPTGVSTKSGSLDGSSRITLANEGNFDREHNQPFSISAWVRISSIGAAETITAKGNDFTSAVGYYFLVRAGGTLRFRMHATTDANVNGVAILIANRWYHVVCTYAGASNVNGMKIYVDGVLDATGAALVITGTMLNNNSFVIGAESDGSNPFTGFIRNVKFWDVELVLADVQQLFKAGRNRWGVGVADGDDLP